MGVNIIWSKPHLFRRPQAGAGLNPLSLYDGRKFNLIVIEKKRLR
jgi:hypothetical protein